MDGDFCGLAIRAAPTEATEGIAWQMPALRVRGRWLVRYAAFRTTTIPSL